MIGEASKIIGLSYKNRETGESHRLNLDGIFVQIGLVPNTEWLKGSIALSPRGEIEVDARGATVGVTDQAGQSLTGSLTVDSRGQSRRTSKPPLGGRTLSAPMSRWLPPR